MFKKGGEETDSKMNETQKKGQHARQGCISLIRVRIYRAEIRGILTNRESVPFHNLT